MPYIDKNRREELEVADLDKVIKKLTVRNLSAGDLNYIITCLAQIYIAKYGESYQHHNDIIGALENAKIEWLRRKVAPYEDRKIKENGDIY